VVLIPLEPAIYLSAPNGRWFLVRTYGARTREPAPAPGSDSKPN
jgi:hypothetical protein